MLQLRPSRRVAVGAGFISPKLLLILIVLGTLIGLLYFGPISTYYAWEDLHRTAYDETEAIVQHGLAAHVSQQRGPFNPALKHAPPSIHTLRFFVDYAAFGLPDRVEFRGTSTEGAFTGTYNPHTGEVECSADLGGHVVPGLDAAKPGDEQIKIAGTFKNNKMDVKVNGKPAVIRDAPTRKPGAPAAAEEDEDDEDEKPAK